MEIRYSYEAKEGTEEKEIFGSERHDQNAAYGDATFDERRFGKRGYGEKNVRPRLTVPLAGGRREQKGIFRPSRRSALRQWQPSRGTRLEQDFEGKACIDSQCCWF